MHGRFFFYQLTVLKWMKLALIERRDRISKKTSATGTPTFSNFFAPQPEENKSPNNKSNPKQTNPVLQIQLLFFYQTEANNTAKLYKFCFNNYDLPYFGYNSEKLETQAASYSELITTCFEEPKPECLFQFFFSRLNGPLDFPQ